MLSSPSSFASCISVGGPVFSFPLPSISRSSLIAPSIWASPSPYERPPPIAITVRLLGIITSMHSQWNRGPQRVECYTYHFCLLAILALSDLCGSFFIQVSRLDFVLEFSQFRALSADLFNFASMFFLVHLHASHLSSQVLFKIRHIYLSICSNRPSPISDSELLACSRVECGLSECHISPFKCCFLIVYI